MRGERRERERERANLDKAGGAWRTATRSKTPLKSLHMPTQPYDDAASSANLQHCCVSYTPLMAQKGPALPSKVFIRCTGNIARAVPG